MLKAAIKHATSADQVRQRTVPQDVVAKWSERLDSMKQEMTGVLEDEQEEKQVGFYFCVQ
jgi:ATP-dependent RNA helicase DDX27